jgi:tRNA dimethylallyltransferase
MNNCVVILGPTASGKTALATRVAAQVNGEIISADSRQIYQQLNIGTGKDLHEYTVNGVRIPYHLIDHVPPERQYYLHEFVRDLRDVFLDITARGKLPIVCGGTGLYLDALHKGFEWTQVPEDKAWHSLAQQRSKEELLAELNAFPTQFTAAVDRHSVKRIIRGIEIARYRQTHPLEATPRLDYQPFYIGTAVSREVRHQKINRRLKERLDHGLIEETQQLLAQGVSPERLDFLGLEYRYVLQHLQGKLSREALEEELGTAIRQFSRRQMTWFRKMEKEGRHIHWLDMEQPATATDLAIQLVKKAFSL